MDKLQFQENLTEARKKRGYTQREVARAIGVSDKTYSKWETGENEPDIDALCRLGEFYGVSPALFFREGETAPELEGMPVEEAAESCFRSTPPLGIVEAAALGKLLELEDPERTIPRLRRLGLLYFDSRTVDGRETEVCFFTPLAEPLALLCLADVLFPREAVPEVFVAGGGWHFRPLLCDGPLPADPSLDLL